MSFDQEYPQTSSRALTRNRDAVNSSADHHHVEMTSAQRRALRPEFHTRLDAGFVQPFGNFNGPGSLLL